MNTNLIPSIFVLHLVVEHFLQNIHHQIRSHWFRNHFIDLVTPGFLDVFFLSVACTSDDHGLFNIIDLAISPDFGTCFIAIHNGHAAIHQDDAVTEALFTRSLETFKSV